MFRFHAMKCGGVAQVHTLKHNQAEAMHTMVGLPASDSSSGTTPPESRPIVGSPPEDGAALVTVRPEEQLLETWMLLEFCDQGNLEAAARDCRFQDNFVRRPR